MTVSARDPPLAQAVRDRRELAPILAGTVAHRFGIEHVVGLAIAAMVLGVGVVMAPRETAQRGHLSEETNVGPSTPAPAES